MNYKDHAYERTIVGELQAFLRRAYISSDSEAEKTMTCEEVFFGEREVPQEALLRVLSKLTAWEADQRAKMGQYEWKKNDGLPEYLANDPPPDPIDADEEEDPA